MNIEEKGVEVKRYFSVTLDEGEIAVLVHRISGEESWMAKRIEDGGFLPENHEEIAFDLQEKLRKLIR